jgi:hypothetical protein
MARPLSSATPSSSVTPLSHGLSSLSTWLSTSSCTGTTSRAREASASGGRSTSPLARSPNSFSISVCFPPAHAWVIKKATDRLQASSTLPRGPTSQAPTGRTCPTWASVLVRSLLLSRAFASSRRTCSSSSPSTSPRTRSQCPRAVAGLQAR